MSFEQHNPLEKFCLKIILLFLELFSFFQLKLKINVDKFFCLRKFKNYKSVYW